ncbi:hypothetical protein JL49_23510 [Pseudoalteromonas luteoviolacea]|nr:hypothetical protein JL49_23510 [Pseudoalteromonas luteoviolacea]
MNQLKEQQPIITKEAYEQDDETVIQNEMFTHSLSTLDVSIAWGILTTPQLLRLCPVLMTFQMSKSLSS